jgi:hypothetical protein
MGDPILGGCDEIKSMKDAQKPIITPLLPVKGLRHNENGDLTEDALKTIMDGLSSLGINVDTEDAQNAILMETRQSLCNLNAQYQFLLTTLFMSIRKDETLSGKLIELLREKNTAMRDILSVSRQILEKAPANKDGKKFIEGWTDVNAGVNNKTKAIEGFVQMQNKLVGDANALSEKRYEDLAKENFDNSSAQGSADVERSLQISEQRIESVSANLSLYSFLNVIAVGLLFYIVSTN